MKITHAVRASGATQSIPQKCWGSVNSSGSTLRLQKFFHLLRSMEH